MAKLEMATEAVKKDYRKALEIDGTSVNAMYDAITVLRYMAKNKLKATKMLTNKQHRMIVNLVDMLEGWKDLEDYKAAQEATALANLMNDNFRNLQECSNTMKTTVDSQNTNGEAVNKQLQELKQSVAALQSIVEDLQTTNTQTTLQPNSSQPRPSTYAAAVNKPSLSPFSNPCHANVVARAKLANQHVIVKPMADETCNKMNKQSEKDLVSEMNKALASMATNVEDTLCRAR
ncbi:hypothetical protein F5146DRAFT_1139142 [Armillaria mellea]|nr:hypothetical protein F5146DRAFT_1139142 [Armillaria mellea]